LIALVLSVALAQEVPTDVGLDPFEKPWQMLQELEASGYPDIASAEVLRALADHADDPRAPHTRLRLSRFQRKHGHLLAEQYALASGVDQDPAWKPWFQLALLDTYMQRSDFDGLAKQALAIGEADPKIGDAVAFYAAWGHAGTGQPADAIAALSRVSGPLGPQAGLFSADLDRWDEVRQRSAAGAVGLSVIPGAGHVYAGRPGTGLVYAAVVGGLGAGTVLLLQEDRDWAGGLLAVMTLSMWSSTAADAGVSARAFNQAQRLARLEHYRNEHWIRAELDLDGPAPLDVRIGLPEGPNLR